MKVSKAEHLLSIHESNLGQLTAALKSAKCDLAETITEEVRKFLYTLAANNVMIAANHEPQAKKPRKARAPKAEKIEKVAKAPRKVRKSALAAAAEDAATATADA